MRFRIYEKVSDSVGFGIGIRHIPSGRDMLLQTVPSTDSSNREGPIIVGGQPCTSDIQQQ